MKKRGWVCPKCGYVCNPDDDTCKLCSSSKDYPIAPSDSASTVAKNVMEEEVQSRVNSTDEPVPYSYD